jgi:hypothetical protein
LADTTNENNQSDTPGDLRVQLETALAEIKTLKQQNQSYTQDEQLREAGLGHLSKRQRRVILRELQEDGTDFTADAAKDIAKELGYKTEAEPAPTNQQQQSQQDQGQQSNGNSDSTNDAGDTTNDEPESALTAIALMQQASGMSAGTPVNNDFSTEMKGARNKEELRSLIRNKGARHGVIHDWDVP